MIDFLEFLIEPYRTHATWQIVLEIVATLFGIISVYYTYKRDIKLYPTTIISTGIFMFLFFRWGLYGETIIQIYYVSMAIYGWLLWKNELELHQQELQVSWATTKEYRKALLFFVASFLFILMVYYFRPLIENNFNGNYLAQLKIHYTKIDLIDATTTAVFLVGMWMMAKRKIDNWIFWIIGDLIMIPLMIYKGAVITSLQYIVLLVLSIIGLVDWIDTQKTQKNKL
ncbi:MULTISPECIES: nicotinamide riboside transporter PnuC [Weeksella]|uniref:Nicotinamide riboside transporter PnuC n=1 Tax=Weeksella virosa (strain ATCC 43766 / DSM 16922 / JCM 21250 / CCUG 30538 / CDC 9751 / IAM 14551 / NBRC 16016 / NCTC 11634 / CL345/78) TaxID=865938 RepID=F0P0I2_WEEVC|nr:MULTISPECIES: nicotinamide riboside transporter PnuC [Weeksella]ADX67466.1 nicotinamide mononucleotide transporter PnuC [Weeksella virosa DSM 16922]MDK7374307.1 nicotinamide riboside transporter PnuC [Weeksella virosa]MDK7675748.1 nicotinamide riboside transporter PnuC [Weeksella virosa]VEH62791.1 Nicotinamide riboside transporter pnuC [Weeksella virosa]